MNVFSNPEFSEAMSPRPPLCKCGAFPRIVCKMMDPNTGRTVRMFECGCGERSWTEAEE